MKVCGKKDVHVPGCSDCSELEERVEAVEECCNDAHEEIDGKADKTYVDDSIDTVNQTISHVADTLNERISNLIASGSISTVTLWEGSISEIGHTAHLDDDVNNYDYIDIYYTTSPTNGEGNYGYVRIPADQYANYTITVGGTAQGNDTDLIQTILGVSLVDDYATVESIREWQWDGDYMSSAAIIEPPSETVVIYRIDGIKQIEDGYVRDVTVNGTSVVDQNGIAKILMPELIKTVNGNPIVIDDAFGEVKNLDVELLPIQDLHGYDKPWSAGAGNNIFDQSVRRMPINLPSGTTLYIKHNAAGTYGLYGLDENETSVELSMMSPNTLYTVTLDRNITLLAISQGFLDDLVQNNATLMVSKTSFTTIEPYTNICPITGHDSVTVGVTGKNIFDISTNYIEQGTITSSDGQSALGSTRIRTHGYAPVLAETTYAISINGTVNAFYAHYYDETYAYLGSTGAWKQSGTAITTPSGTKYMRLVFSVNGTATEVTPSDVSSVQIEHGSTPTDFAPYHGQSKTVTLPHTVYGAGVGVTSGSGKEKKVIVDISTLNWSRQASAGLVDRYMTTDLASVIQRTPAIMVDLISSVLVASSDPVYDRLLDGQMCVLSSTGALYVSLNGYTSADDFKTAMAGQTICYPLATPTDLQTTPTSLTLYNGDNVISSDGDMDLTYVQDMAAVIRKIENQL